jgi:hypothetical protein
MRASWLVLAAVGGVGTLWQIDRLIASASQFPGISVLGIAQTLLFAEVTFVAWLRWSERSRASPRRYGWILLAAASALVGLLTAGTGSLASRPPGLAPGGLALVLVGLALAAFAWWRSGRPRSPTSA